MSNFGERLKHGVREVLPPAIFFLAGFQLIAFTRYLILEEYGFSVPGVAAATIGAR